MLVGLRIQYGRCASLQTIIALSPRLQSSAEALKGSTHTDEFDKPKEAQVACTSHMSREHSADPKLPLEWVV